jgi:hypothetical protein
MDFNQRLEQFAAVLRFLTTTLRLLAQIGLGIVGLVLFVIQAIKGNWIEGMVYAVVIFAVASLFAPSAENMARLNAWSAAMREEQEEKNRAGR